MKLNHILLAGLTAVALSACDESFDDWTTPAANEQEEQISFAAGTFSGVTSLIDFATLGEAETVQVCTLTAPVASAEGYSTTYSIELDGAETYSLTSNGLMQVADLKDYIVATWGQAPTEHDIKAMVTALVSNGTDATRFVSDAYTMKVKLNAPEIEQSYYLTGSINKWDNTDTTYELTNDGSDPYANPTFTCRIPAPADGGNVEFKFTPKSGLGGDWSKCLTAGSTEGTFAYNNAGGNLVVTAVEGAKFYDLTFNMLEFTWSYSAVKFNPYLYEAGVNNSWGAKEQALYCADGNGLYTGFFYAQDADWSGRKGAFKFTGAFNDWSQGNYGTGTNTDEGGTLIDSSDSGNILVTPGFYRADVDMASMTFTLTAVKSVFVVGSAVNNDWDKGVEMTYNLEKLCWECDTELGEGVIKFKGNGTWDNQDGNWGGTLDNIINGSNDNIPVSVTGKVHIEFYPTCDTKSYATVTAQ